MIDLFLCLFGRQSYSFSPEEETQLIWLSGIFGFISGMIVFYNLEQFIKSLPVAN